MLSFSNNSGPAFIFGVVGAGIFSSSRVGLLLYLIHTLASVCVGLVFRYWGLREDKRRSTSLRPAGAALTPAKPQGTKFSDAFVDAVKSSFQTTINICGFVIFFTVFIKLLFLSGLLPLIASGIGAVFSPFGFDRAWAERLLTGLIELTSGVWSLSGAAGELPRSMAMAAFMLGWAGLSVHCQVLSFIGDSGLSVRTYIFGKFLQAGLSAVFAFFLSHLFVWDEPTAVFYAEQVKSYAAVDFGSALLISVVSCALLLVLFMIGARKSAIRRGLQGVKKKVLR